MKIRPLLALFSLIVCSLNLIHAQSNDFIAGARSMSLANTSVTISDEWAIFNNISGIAELSDIYTSASYKSRFSVAALGSLHALCIVPTKHGSLGLSLFRLGDELYNEQKIGVGYANHIGFVNLGFKCNYMQLNAEGFGSNGALILEFGGIAELFPWLTFGAHIFNLNQASLLEFEDERFPIIMKAGIAIKPEKNLTFHFEVYKDLLQEVQIRAGMEYDYLEKVWLRAGVQRSPTMPCIGFGFKPGNVAIDYAFGAAYVPGQLHEFSFTYKIVKQ
ncbi:MAG: hypothetical protein ACFCUU_09685 [Cyclobacteriaceae bacterium]